MVVYGQWPYAHTVTLLKFKDEGIGCFYYNVDNNTIINEEDAEQLIESGWTKDDINLIIASNDLYHRISFQTPQLFPPEIPLEIEKLVNAGTPTHIKQAMEEVSNVAPAIIRCQSSQVMKDIGFKYNPHIGVWIGHGETLQGLREKKRQLVSDKIEHRFYMGNRHQIYGDTTMFTEELKDAGAIYNDKDEVWYIDICNLGKISHIFD